MKVSKEKVKKEFFGRFGLFDLVFIIIVIAIFAAAAYYFLGGKTSEQKKDIFFTVELTWLPLGYENNIAVGGGVKDAVLNQYVGTVEDVETENQISWNYDNYAREYREFIVQDQQTVLVTVKARGYENDKEIVTESGTVLKVGKLFSIEGKGFGSSGYIVDLRTEG
ncbi:MAG: DUF4330 domain-containing protein [Clostridiales bacterium]|nr:DUF4330 domain-containing protein [Clostridiales bacterium]